MMVDAESRRLRIDNMLRLIHGPGYVSLEETHPVGDKESEAFLDQLWTLAEIGVDSQFTGMGFVTTLNKVAWWVACAISCANFGPQFVCEQLRPKVTFSEVF